MILSRRIFPLLLLAFALPGYAEPIDLSKRRSILPQEVPTLQQEVIFLDVRSDSEWNAGHIKGAIHVPFNKAAQQVPSLMPDRSVPIIAYCSGGGRAASVVKSLRKQGYTVVPVTRGGFLQLVGHGMEYE